MQVMIGLSAGLIIAAAIFLIRKTYIDHATYKTFLADCDRAREHAIGSQVVRDAYSNGWNAGYKQACDDSKASTPEFRLRA
ncbi:hypothetical protein [Paracoccus sulfuroxidans]|uniref:Uncharacterized protein n=1 Tax=Paracoccus sulfuroxidans TaxID=384678 RepID=A0A562N7S6_9RHOB|nr:hypothetical protein [Paracoccus sulfuroxidans]TWI28164.1 hypothetical protein IQ24_03781 [Paracoccus sulfuroxidans]